MTERERRAMLRGRPDVTCWESFLAEVAARRGGAARPATVALPTPLVPAAARSVRATAPGRLSEAA